MAAHAKAAALEAAAIAVVAEEEAHGAEAAAMAVEVVPMI